MLKKIFISCLLCFSVIISSFVSVKADAEMVVNGEEIITQFTTTENSEHFRLLVFAEPEIDICIEIVNSEASFPPNSTQTNAILNTFAGIGQITTDKLGTAHYDFSVKNPGTYTVRYSKVISKSLLYNQPRKDFFALTWPSKDYGTHTLTPMPMYRLVEKLHNNDIDTVVSEVGTCTQKMPKGRRMVYFDRDDFQKYIAKNSENTIWWDSGAQYLHELLSEFFRAYKDAGYSFDYIVMDTEEYGTWNSVYSLDADGYKAITQNEKYPELRQKLEERGFEFCSDEELGELYYIVDSTNATTKNQSLIWHNVIHNMMAEYVTYATYDAAVQYFPDIKMGNWEHMDLNSWYKIPGHGGQRYYGGGNYNKTGTHSTFEAYGETAYIVDSTPENFNKTRFEGVPFNVMLMGVNRAKATYLSDEEGKLQPWIASLNYRSGIEGLDYTLANTPYYAEQIFHLGMLDPEPFLYFNPKENMNASDEAHKEQAYILAMLFEELAAVSPSADRMPIKPEYPSWNKRYLISGMTDGEKNIWRITPDLSVEGMTLENFVTDTNVPAFSIEGRTVTFSEGRILGDLGFGNESCGYWVETPADVYPIETVSEDLAMISPAIYADFDSFKSQNLPVSFSDSSYHAGSIDRSFWDAGGDYVIQYDNDDNVVMSIQGGSDASLWYYYHPGRVRVLGNNKEKQIWEIKFKLPASTSWKTEKFYMLGSCDDDHEEKSIYVEDSFWGTNTLYCENNGSKQAITELSSDTWYTLRREIDFSGSSVVSDVYVYNSDGSLKASKTGIIYPTVTFPVEWILFKANDYGDGKNILIDEFKVCLDGLDVELEVYDYKTGIQLSEIPSENAVVAVVNYNNAESTDVPYILVHAAYDGDELSYTEVLSEGVFAAGSDGALWFELFENRKAGTTDKFFIWDSLEGLKPLQPSVDITNK